MRLRGIMSVWCVSATLSMQVCADHRPRAAYESYRRHPNYRNAPSCNNQIATSQVDARKLKYGSNICKHTEKVLSSSVAFLIVASEIGAAPTVASSGLLRLITV